MGQIIIKVPGRTKREFVAEDKQIADALLALLDKLTVTATVQPQPTRRRRPKYPTEEEFNELLDGMGRDMRRNGVRESDAEEIVRRSRAEQRRRAA